MPVLYTYDDALNPGHISNSPSYSSFIITRSDGLKNRGSLPTCLREPLRMNFWMSRFRKVTWIGLRSI